MSVLIALGIGVVFIWSARSGQFDDLEGPAHRMLMDDDRAPHDAAGKADDRQP